MINIHKNKKILMIESFGGRSAHNNTEIIPDYLTLDQR